MTMVELGEIDRIYIQSPDRLASGAKLMIPVDELREKGVEIIFLRGTYEDTPEGKLMLHIQGGFAEYERAKIAERTRRGKLYWARQGALVGYMNAYGYRFIRRSEGHRTHVEADEYQASVLREMYRWLIDERMSFRAIAKRLTGTGIRTARGAVQWQPTAVQRILRNPIYKGIFIYQRHQRVRPEHRMNPDRYRKNRKTGRKPRPQEEWIEIKVPAIVDEETWEAAQRQILENARFSGRNNKRHRYLLRGLIRCSDCGVAYTGSVQHGYRRYVSTRLAPTLSSKGHGCIGSSVSADLVEDVVWRAVSEALRRPEVLKEEYERRLKEARKPGNLDRERKQLALALKRVTLEEDRVTYAYIKEAMDLGRYKLEMDKLKAQRGQLEAQGKDLDRRQRLEHDSRSALVQLESFSQRVARGLERMTFEERQKLLRLLVERITIADGTVRIETVIPTDNTSGPVQLRTRHPEPVEG